MMRTTKHKMDNVVVPRNTKKTKSKMEQTLIEKTLFPQHIVIKNNKVIYHFNEFSTATKICDSELLREQISVAYTRCEHGKNHRNCQTVSLTPEQFDYLVGQHAYQFLLEIKKSLTSYDIKSTSAQLVGMNPKLANYAALVIDETDGCLFLEWIFGENQKKETCDELASFFIPLLDSELINRLIIENIDGFYHLLPNNIQSYIFENLTAETCNLIAVNIDSLVNLVQNVQDEALLIFFKKLNTKMFDSLALALTKKKDDLLENLAKYCSKDELLQYFVSQLTPNVCEKVNERGLIDFWKFADVKSLKIFLSKLNPATQVYQTFRRNLLNKKVSTRAILQSLAVVAKYPKEVKAVSDEDPHLDIVEFWDGGRSYDSWSKITRKIVTQAPAPSLKKSKNDLSLKLDNTHKRISSKPLSMDDILGKKWRYLRMQGRTILLIDSSDEILAVKIQKESEPMLDLYKEFQTTSYLNSNKNNLALKSRFPTPIDIISLKGIFDWLVAVEDSANINQLEKMIGKGERKRYAYLYKINPKQCDYFTYLHDPILSDEVFHQANRDAVHDLFVLLQHGVVFSQLADIFHNSEHTKDRPDKGRYIVLVNLIKNWDHGSGRITGWQESVAYPNIRASGIADLGDRISINTLIGDSEYVDQFYGPLRDEYGEKTGNLLLANLMAEYQYVLFLIAGRRGYELTKKAKIEGQSSNFIENIWKNIAKQIMDNCTQAVSILTKLPEKQVKNMLSSIVDVNRLAIQMQYWMTEEYIQDILNNRVRDDVYGLSTQVFVNITKFRKNTFNSKKGCSIDGVHSDLGPVNGQEPIKEANKLFYWMITQIFAEYEKMHVTLNDLKKITSTKNLNKSEKLRQQSFSYLPEKAYHSLQFILCNERLKQPLSEKQRQSLLAEAKEHKEHHAASVIQNSWRNRRY